MIIADEDPTFNKMQNVKRRFFALRNGDIADVYRRAGSPYRIIFGLQLPQIVEVADAVGADSELAGRLWANDTTRESRLLAPMVVDRSSFDIAHARAWIESLKGVEECDVLCHRLLRKLDYARVLVGEYAEVGDDMRRYAALRLARNIMATNLELAYNVAKGELARDCELTRRLAAETLEEVSFLRGDG